MGEEFDIGRIKNKTAGQLKAGKPLLGKDGAFAPFIGEHFTPPVYSRIIFIYMTANLFL